MLTKLKRLFCKKHSRSFLAICLISFSFPLFIFIKLGRHGNHKSELLENVIHVEKIVPFIKTSLPFVDHDNDNDNAIDVVYTWVNGSDPEHLKLARKYKKLEGRNTMNIQVEYDSNTNGY